MEHPLTGTPLDEIQLLFLDLTAKIESNIVSIDEALTELQSHEVVDEAGFTWRIDPMTQSFIRHGPEPGAAWRPADPSQYAGQNPEDAAGNPASPRAESRPFGTRTAPPTTPAGPHATYTPGPAADAGIGDAWVGPDTVASSRGPVYSEPVERRGKHRRWLAVTAVLAIGAVAGAYGFAGHRRGAGTELSPQKFPVYGTAPRATPTVTQQAPKLGVLDLKRYRPASLKSTPAPRQIVLTWRLPPDAQRDGAGIIIRQTPTDGTTGLAALSRTGSRLPQTYVAVPLDPGRQYCFLVGVLLQKTSGGMTLAQSGRVCATPL